ncbi:MAG: RbsD or FucU transport [Chloroflexi bacterium]|nr:RbsD or FucU transport [Chloroflexota bacterium]
MLKTKLTHPEIIGALGKLGHGSQVLIADGNYPIATGTNPSATHVFLNLTPGIVSATDALRAIVDMIAIESAAVMVPDSGKEPDIFDEFRYNLPQGLALRPLNRAEFYATARDANTGLVIATGEQRIYANILLTIGVVG